MPNFIEIGGGSRKFSKKLVDMTRNDPYVNFPRGKNKATSIDLIEREMAPTRRRRIASRHLVCKSCSCWVQFDTSICTHSWTEMAGGARVFTRRGCREVARLVGEVEYLRNMMESMKMMVMG